MPNNDNVDETESGTTPAVSPVRPLEGSRQELERARAEYSRISEHLVQVRQALDVASQKLTQEQAHRDQLIARRDELNKGLRDKRREIGELHKVLEDTNAELDSLEAVARGVRRDAAQAKSRADHALSDYSMAQAERDRIQHSWEEAVERVKSAQKALDAAGGIAMPGKKVKRSDLAVHRNNPWIAGSFYLFALVVIAVLFAVISMSVPWYALIVVFIGGMLAMSIVGAFQLRNDQNLSERSFVKLMLETFKHLPLLQRNSSRKPTA